MFRNLHLVIGSSLVACFLSLNIPIAANAQSTQGFHYVIPRFTGTAGSELMITNLSARLVSAEVTLLEAGTSKSVAALIPIQAGTHARLTAASFALSSFDGTVVVDSSAPLSVSATLAGPGGLETVSPASSSTNLIVPFAHGTNGSMKLIIFNEEPTSTTVVISALAPDGSTIGSVQRVVPSLTTLIESVSGIFPLGFGRVEDFSHLQIRTASNVFGGERRIYAQAESTGYLNTSEGIVIPVTDFAVVTAVPRSAGILSAVIPFFVHGGDYVSILQLVNASDVSGSVTLTAVKPDGNPIEGTAAATVEVPANGAVRKGVQNLFTLPSGTTVGSIRLQSTVPVIPTEAVGGAVQGAFALVGFPIEAGTGVAFNTRDANDQFFTGFTLLNSGSNPARVTVRNISDSGEANSRLLMTIDPFTSVTRTLVELLPEARKAGFIHISSDVPIVASALEGRVDNASLSNLVALRSQPDYVPPDPTKFLVTGTVRHLGAPLPGARIQLSGAINVATTTDASGVYFFQDTPPGTYTLRIAANGYTFEPDSRTIAITTDSSRSNDFEGTLITPKITVVQPPSVLAGSPDTSVIVVASPITSTTEIVFEGAAVVTTITTAAVPVTVSGATGGTITVIQQTQALKTVLNAATVAVARVGSLLVRTNGPGGSVESEPVTFVVGGPAPILTSMTGVPDPLLIGNPGFTLTVNGAGFSAETKLQVGGVALETTFVSSTQLRAFVGPALLGQGGLLRVTALNPQPTVGPSNELTVSLFNPIPGLTSIFPNSIEVRLDPNSLPLTLTVNGFGFAREAVVLVDNVEVTTEYRSSTQLIGSVPQKLLESAKIIVISVKNPPPTLGTSEALPLSLYNLVPTVTSLDASPILFDPLPRFEGDTPSYPAQVIIRGTNFAKDGLIYVFSTPCNDLVGGLSGTRISSTMVVGAINIACLGTYSLGITNPQPGGGLSNLLSFNVAQYTAPAAVSVSGMSPVAVRTGSDTFTLTISGTNFVAGAVVNFGTAVLFPSTVTANTIVVSVPSYLLRNSGIVPVSVTNPNVTGNSNRILFTIN